MSLEIAEYTTIGHYVIEVQNDRLNFVPKFAIFVQIRELCASALCSFKDWATINLRTNLSSL